MLLRNLARRPRQLWVIFPRSEPSLPRLLLPPHCCRGCCDAEVSRSVTKPDLRQTARPLPDLAKVSAAWKAIIVPGGRDGRGFLLPAPGVCSSRREDG